MAIVYKLVLKGIYLPGLLYPRVRVSGNGSIKMRVFIVCVTGPDTISHLSELLTFSHRKKWMIGNTWMLRSLLRISDLCSPTVTNTIHPPMKLSLWQGNFR